MPYQLVNDLYVFVVVAVCEVCEHDVVVKLCKLRLENACVCGAAQVLVYSELQRQKSW